MLFFSSGDRCLTLSDCRLGGFDIRLGFLDGLC